MAPPSSPQYRVGDLVPYRFNIPIVIASCVIALLGSITTVELLHRKRGTRQTWVNLVNQLGIAVSLGLVAMWCMHFVGNRAIIMGDGNPLMQLNYNAGFTALSAFLPIICLFIAFTLLEIQQPNQPLFWPFLVVSGFILGLSIIGMHYVGNLGISNYTLYNPAPYIVGAATIAIVASITALALFFYFKEKWVNNLAMRLSCATVLAAAASGMHWLATTGTTYSLKVQTGGRTGDRDISLIIAMICAIIACAICLVFAVLTQRRKKELEHRAQHVVLASATFDFEGRLMVTQEGLLPCRKITKQFNQKTFDDEFDIGHPVFQWLYRLSFNWSAISDLVPGMRGRLRVMGQIKDRPSRPSTHATISAYESDVEDDYTVAFREHFCVAADELARMLGIPLDRLGVLYNGILSTGKITRKFRPSGRFGKMDLELGLNHPTMFGKGQLLFAVRIAARREAAQHVLDGYRFASPNQVSEIISRAMIVPHSEVEDTIERLRLYSRPRDPLATGATYLACFAVRVGGRSNTPWEILVPTDQPGSLPNVLLSSEPLSAVHLARMQKLEGLSVNQSLQYLNNITAEIDDDDEKAFVEHLHDQITALTRQVPEDFFSGATFSAEPVPAPGLGGGNYSDSADYDRSLWPAVYAFSVIPDVHAASVKSGAATVTYVPLSFFQVSQRVYPRAPDHVYFARHVREEFADLLPTPRAESASPRLGGRGSRTTLPLRAPSTASIRRSAAGSLSRRPRLARLVVPAIEMVGRTSLRDSLAPVSHWSDSPSVSPGLSPAVEQPGDDVSELLREGADQGTAAVVEGGGVTAAGEKAVVEGVSEDESAEREGAGAPAESGEASEEPTFVDQLFRVASTRWKQR